MMFSALSNRLFPSRQTQRGFTLIELAIVLAVASLLFAGLWRLMASGSTQLRDQATADQQKQLISAVRGYLASPDGQQNFLTPNGTTAFNLAMPTSNSSLADCQGHISANSGFCAYLPTGFTSTTTNSYGQTYVVHVLKDTAATIAPNNYSFAIVTQGGSVIPDTSGGRIASMIGNDGGFLYTTNICGTPAQFACGSYGSWALNINSAYAIATASGHVASRSYIGINASLQAPWLARTNVAGPKLASLLPDYNTLQTHTYLDGTTNSSFNLNGGVLNGSTPSGSFGGSLMNIKYIVAGGVAALENVMVLSKSSCSMGNPSDTSCSVALQINGDVAVTQLLSANKLYAGYFIYNSDARLKHDILPIKGALENLEKIKPVSFVFNKNGEKHLGMIAQDVEKIYPELVLTGKDGMKGIDYPAMTAPLLAAVQELKAQNDTMRAEIDSLTLRLNKLEK